MKLNNEVVMFFFLVIIFFVFFMVIGIVGNVIVCFVYFKRKRKFIFDFFILNLVILDFLICIFGIFMEIIDFCLFYIFYVFVVCKFLRIFEFIISMVFVLILVIIFIDCYKCICKYGESFSIKKVKIFCVVVICIGFFLLWFLLIIVGKKMVDVGVFGIKGVDCLVLDEMWKLCILFVYYIVVLFCFVVCFVFVIFVYVRIFIFVKRIKVNRLRYVGLGDLSNFFIG